VREACLLGALERREAAGVWGGELLENGAIIAVKRARGRPRKNAA
jgi:WhiB family redox-sensing transcriptional regulator